MLQLADIHSAQLIDVKKGALEETAVEALTATALTEVQDLCSH